MKTAAPRSALILSALLAVSVSAKDPAALKGAAANSLPDHYSKIQYPAFAYQPPHPSAYKVTLDRGVTAYLIPDSTLALIQVSLFFGRPNLPARPEETAALNLYSSLL
ncbi:MAG TPA: hypothetical protein VK465_12825, partial [Fibrobacteria bacterium]|nr:hypothetical protein [Fibrobacteria bacterium]